MKRACILSLTSLVVISCGPSLASNSAATLSEPADETLTKYIAESGFKLICDVTDFGAEDTAGGDVPLTMSDRTSTESLCQPSEFFEPLESCMKTEVKTFEHGSLRAEISLSEFSAKGNVWLSLLAKVTHAGLASENPQVPARLEIQSDLGEFPNAVGGRPLSLENAKRIVDVSLETGVAPLSIQTNLENAQGEHLGIVSCRFFRPAE